MAPPVCSSFLRVLPNYMHVVYQWEVFVAEGLWSGRVAGLVGRRRSLAGGAGLSTFPRWGRPSGHATEAHRGVVTAVGAVAVDWPSQAAAEVFGGAS